MPRIYEKRRPRLTQDEIELLRRLNKEWWLTNRPKRR